jgi:hypothetical protein
MTVRDASAALNPAPRHGALFAEELRAAGLALRPAAAVAGVLLALAVVEFVREARESPMRAGVDLRPELGLPGACGALLFAVAAWRSASPAEHGYPDALPVSPRMHATLRMLAGMLWTQLWVVAWLGAMGLVTALTGGHVEPTPPWRWAAPFAGAAVTYLLGSALAVRAAHPWRWAGAALLVYAVLLMLTPTVFEQSIPALVVGGLLFGPHSLTLVTTGMAQDHFCDAGICIHRAPLDAWLVTTLGWLAVAAGLFSVAAGRGRLTLRRKEPAA